MNKWIIGLASTVVLTGVTLVTMAQQPQNSMNDLTAQLKRLNDTVSSRSGTPDINPPVSPSQSMNTPAGGGGDGSLGGNAFTPSPTGQPSLAGGNAAGSGTVAVSNTPGGLPSPVQATEPPPPIRDQAFAEATKNALPMTPEQIRTLKSMFDEAQKAAAELPGTPPKPTSISQIVDLSPGATPPIIRLQSGYVTSIVFLDATGAPWPIAAYDIGDPRSFNVQWDQKGNTLMVQAISGYKTGNVAVVLRELNTPIMLTLLPGQKAVDYRVDLRMPGLGPNSMTTVSHLPEKETPVLLDVLNGVPPQGSTTLKISGCSHCNAWLYNGEVFFRTRLTVLSPGWIATLSSADGMHAYQLPSTPVILVSDKGKMNTLNVEGF